MEHQSNHLPPCVHLGFKIAKLALQAASVAAAFCIVKEIHRVHRSIENHTNK